MSKEHKVLESMFAKGNNKRMRVALLQDLDNEKFITVETKTLIDRESRNILTTSNVYSVETFLVLKDMFKMLIDCPNVHNRHLLKELDNISRFNLRTTF